MINIFCSSIYNMEEYDTLKSMTKGNLSLADHNLNYNMIKGLDALAPNEVVLVNTVPLPSFPHFPKIWIKQQRWKHSPSGVQNDINLGYINLPFLKQTSRYFSCYRALKRLVKKYAKEKVNLLVYDLHPPLVKAMLRIKKKYPTVHTCAILPDIPDTMIQVVFGETPSRMARYYTQAKMKNIDRFDCYVFVTENMKDKVHVKNKPYTVVEGIYDPPSSSPPPPPENHTTEKKVILYSGALREAYGVKRLVDMVAEMEKMDYELWLCGGGELTAYITDQAKIHPNIHYFGYVSSDTIRQLQLQATVLINPRKNDAEYTKYSFPSKTMEYLASGKPVIGYILDGYPGNYKAYIHAPQDESDEALKNIIMEICSLPQEVRNRQGEQSRKFIVDEKNPQKQCTKIRNMLNAL